MASTTITHDSELMKLHVCAIPVPPSRRFYTVRDENDRPLVFSVGLDQVLYALKENSSGARTLVNLSKALAIDETKELVSTLDVAQDWQSDDIYLTFTTAPVPVEGGEKPKPNENTQYRLNVLRPFDPSLIDADAEQRSLQHLLVAHKTKGGNKKITKVFMADGKVAGAAYPEVMVSYVALNSIHKSTDVARIKFDQGLKTWTMASDFDLPENVTDVVDLCPAVSAYGPGYFALYRIQGQARLVFITTQKVSGFAFEVSLNCPSGARAIRTYREFGRRALSAVLVGGDGLHHWASNEYLRAGQPGRLVSATNDFRDVVQLDVAQSQGMLSVFAETEAYGLSYARVPVSNSNFAEPLTSINLVAEGLGGAYSPFVDPKDLTQQVIVANKTGVLTLLSQDQSTGYWQSSPFYVPDPDKVIEYSGYMTRVVFTKPKGNNYDIQVPLVDQPVVMKYPVYTDVLVNGRSITIGPSGTQVLTDNRGVLSYLIPSSVVAADFVTLENPGGGDPDILSVPLEIDPTQKVFEKLATLETAQGLKDAKLPNGRKLLANSNASGRDIEQYAAALKAMGEQRRKLKNGETPRVARESTLGVAAVSMEKTTIACSAGWSGMSRNADQTSAMSRAARGNFIQSGLEALRDLLNSARETIQWGLEKVGDQLELSIERTDRPGLRFFLTSLLHITEAISVIFDFVFEAVDDFLEFLQAVLDIEAWGVAKRYIVRLANGAFDMAGVAIDRAQDKVSSFFDEIDDDVKNFIFPPELDGLGIFEMLGGGGQKSRDAAGKSLETETTDSSVKANYMEYQLTHGGVGTSLNRTVFPFPEQEGITNLWNDVIQPLLDQFVSIIEQAAKDIILLFNDKDDVTFGQALSRLSYNLISGLIELVKRLVNGLLELAKEILASMKSVMNKRLDNVLLDLITGGDSLTVMDIAGWIMAPFVHLGYVAVTGEGMPEGNAVPDFAGAASGSQEPEKEASGIKTKAAKAEEEPEGYVNESEVSEAAQRFDLAAGIIEGVVRVAGMIEGFVSVLGGKSPASAGAPSTGGMSRARKLPPTDSRAQLYKFQSPDPLTHCIFLSTGGVSSALIGGLSTRAAKGKFSAKAALPWIGTIFKAIGVIITFPEYHPPHAKGVELARKLSAWIISFIDLIGCAYLKVYPGVGDGQEVVFSMFMSFLGFWPSLMAAVLDFKEAKKEKEDWPDEDTAEKKKRMAAARLSLVFVDGIGAIGHGFLGVSTGGWDSVIPGIVVAVTAAAGVSIVETTVVRCWETQSKNYFVCV